MFGKRERPTEKLLSIPDFTTRTDLPKSTLIESNEVTVTADDAWVFTALVRGADAELSINGGSWAKDGVFRNGDTLKLRVTTSSEDFTEVLVDLYAQSLDKQWSVVTFDPLSWTPLVLGDDLVLWVDVADAESIVLNGSKVSQWSDKSINGYHAVQSTETQQPTYQEDPALVVFDIVDDNLVTNLPAVTGSMILSTPNGTAVYGVSIPAGDYVIGMRGEGRVPDNAIVGQIIIQGDFPEDQKVYAFDYLRALGGGDNYGNVTNFTRYWRNREEITSFPLIDTSNATDLTQAWNNCPNLASFPLIDTSKVTNFNSAWYACRSLTSFPEIDTSSATNFGFAWMSCSGLTSFPLLDATNVISFSYTWLGCNSLTSFPLLNSGKVTNFTRAWNNCYNLASFPLLDTSSGTNFDYTWDNCTSLTSFPEIDTSSGTRFNNTWFQCTSLTSFPSLDVSNGTTFSNAWRNCTSLTSFPALDLSSATTVSLAWQGCTGLTSFPLLTNTSSITNFAISWRGCTGLTSFPLIDTSSGTSFYQTWADCKGFVTFPEIDTSSGTNFFQTWLRNESLVSFPLLDVSNGTRFFAAWQNCLSLTDFPANFFDNWTATPANDCFVNSWQYCNSLTATSVGNILNSIDASSQSAPASGVDITIDYDATSGTPPISLPILNLPSRGWSIKLNGTEPTWSFDYLVPELVLWLDATDVSTITLNGSTVSQWSDKSGNDYHAVQATETEQPIYQADPARVIFDKTDDVMVASIPATIGTMVLATPNGTAAYDVNIPSGGYEIGAHGGLYMPDNAIVSQVISERPLSEQEKTLVVSHLRTQGGGDNYGAVTDFSEFWREWEEITSFPLIDTSNATNFYFAWYGCSSLTSFPLLQTSNVQNFSNTWRFCSGLTSFPEIDTSSVTNMSFTWQSCSGLTSFPLINTSNVTNMSGAWQNCSSLTSFPAIDVSSSVNLIATWLGCTGLTSFPLINTSTITNMTQTWWDCSSLTSFPLIDTSNVTFFVNTWFGCSSLTSFPEIDTSSATTLSGAWIRCRALTEFPLLDTANVTNLTVAWRDCNGLLSFPLLNTSNVTNFSQAWFACVSLVSFPSIDLSKGTTFYQTWINCTSLENFPANMFDSWVGTPANNCFVGAWDGCNSLPATSVGNILNSIDASGQSAPASGVDITIDYDAGTGTPNIATAITNLKSRGWTITLNGVPQ